jgi:hypothetical protein
MSVLWTTSGMSEQHGPKKTRIPNHEVSNEEVDKAQRPSSPPSGKEDIKEVTPYSSLPSCEPCNELGFGELSRDFILWIGDPVILSVSELILSNEEFDPDNELTPRNLVHYKVHTKVHRNLSHC